MSPTTVPIACSENCAILDQVPAALYPRPVPRPPIPLSIYLYLSHPSPICTRHSLLRRSVPASARALAGRAEALARRRPASAG